MVVLKKINLGGYFALLISEYFLSRSVTWKREYRYKTVIYCLPFSLWENLNLKAREDHGVRIFEDWAEWGISGPTWEGELHTEGAYIYCSSPDLRLSQENEVDCARSTNWSADY
jgi:hypothetical protein